MDSNLTLEYYSKKAQEFSNDTQGVVFTELQDRFLEYLKPNSRILDLGCGSGRDSRYFKEKGHFVVAVDGCRELCKIASDYIGMPVICSTFQNFETEDTFDAIWACASLLHLSSKEIPLMIKKYAGRLNENGCFYLSFKYGEFSGVRNGRYFTDLTESAFERLISGIDTLKIDALSITSDARKGREDEKWLNAYCIKRSDFMEI